MSNVVSIEFDKADRGIATVEELKHLTDIQLVVELKESINTLSILTRRAGAELRERILPILQEIRRRFKAGEKVEGHKGWEAFLRAHDLPPATVRSWEQRARDGDPFEFVDEPVQTPELDKEPEPEEPTIIDDILGFAKKPMTFAQKRECLKRNWRHVTAKREERKRNRRYQEQLAAENAAKDAFVKEARAVISAGKKARAMKLHPDQGGTSEAMHLLNSAVERLLKFIDAHETSLPFANHRAGA